MNAEFIQALDEIERTKNIKKEFLIETINDSIVSAYKKNFGGSSNTKVTIDSVNGDVKVYAQKTVVENVTNDLLEISLAKARDISKLNDIGMVVDIEVTPKKFGRIAAQLAKHIVIQRIKEAERNNLFDDMSNRLYKFFTGTVRRFEKKNVIVEINDFEAILPPNEQIKTEKYEIGSKIRVYVTDVRKSPNGNFQIFVSRAATEFISKLFEIEVQEIGAGIISIKSVAREAGSRAKIAVCSNDPKIDPVGSCIGQKGVRIQNILNNLNGEKVDIIKWSEDINEYIAASLSPAKIVSIDVNEEAKTAKIIVPDSQFSLAIGKGGQNVRLAARLTGVKIDIQSDAGSPNS